MADALVPPPPRAAEPSIVPPRAAQQKLFEPTLEALRAQALAHYQGLRPLASQEGRGEADLADPQLSFQVAQCLPDLDFLASLQRQRSERERLQELNRYLAGYIPRLRAVERMKGLGPTNGCGAKPAGL